MNRKQQLSKKPSGAAYKRLKNQRDNDARKMQNQWKTWLNVNCRSNKPNTDSTDDINNSPEENASEYESFGIQQIEEHFESSSSWHGSINSEVQVPTEEAFETEKANEQGNIEKVHVVEIIQNNNYSKADEVLESQQLNFHDPGMWPLITDKVRCCLVEHGPDQNKNEYFPTDSGNRRFNRTWFDKILPNGEKVNRQWMMYSSSNDALFCFPCILFSTVKQSSFADLSKGFCDWVHLSPRVPDHENSLEHRKSYIAWKDLEKRLREGKTIDDDIQKAIQNEKEKWRNILKVIIDVIMFCAKNNLSLRGDTDVIGETGCGIFLSTIELISHYNLQLAEHIATVKANKKSTSYFSPQIQNELITLMGGKVRKEIISRIKEAKYYSIMFDCTPDNSHKEQMTEIIRYVLIKNGECTIEESFIDFIESHEKTGLGLATEITEKLVEDGLNLKDCRGQGYDNGANMAGKYSGVQARISSENPLAKFVPCAAHTLNLVGVHAAEVLPSMITFFGRVQKIFNYFSGSPARWERLMDTLKISLKGHSATRWSARKEAITALHTQIIYVFKLLVDISQDSSLTAETVSGAKDLVKQIDFTFICLLDMWHHILSLIDRVNRSLQAKNMSVDVASKQLRGLIASIQMLRDKGVKGIIESARVKITGKNINIDPDFPDKRLRKAKRLSLEEAPDEGHLLTPERDFERQCNSVFDCILTQMQWRFESMNELSYNFEFLSGESLANLSVEQLQESAKNLALKYGSDLDAVEFVSEVESFKYQVNSMMINLKKATPLDILKFIHSYSLVEVYPNIEIALRIFLTIPVTVASCERSFSKLKLVKNYLRSSMGQERLSNLAILSIEFDVAKCVNYDDLIDDFASLKARKLHFH